MQPDLWKKIQDIHVGDILITDTNINDVVKSIAKQDDNYILYI